MIYTNETDKLVKNSDELLNTLAMLFSDPMLVVDEKEIVQGCSDTLLSDFGLGTIDEFVKKSRERVSNLFIKEHGYFVPNKIEWMSHLGEGMPLVLIKNNRGIQTPYRLSSQPIKLEGKIFYIVLLRNVEEIARAKKAQKYFETFKQQFLTNISHEFRTPMNSIIGFSALLEQTRIDPLQEEYIGHIRSSGSAMLENIENLLELMQIESGTQRVDRQPFSTYATFEAFSKQFADIAKQKGVGLFFMIDPNLPEKLIADSDKIKKVLRNLITNALKFTAKGGQVLVEIKVLALGAKPTVRYSVTDTGEGIPKEKLQTLLRPFASTRENQIRGKDGFGIGLTLAFKLLKMMKTELSVASEVGKGSRFSFTMKHPRISAIPFKLMKGSNFAIWYSDNRDIVHSKILRRYLRLFNLNVKEVADLAGDELVGVDALFMISDAISHPQLDSLHDRYEELQIIPVINREFENKTLESITRIEDILFLPILPTPLYETLQVIWKKVPKALISPQDRVDEKDRSRVISILIAEDNPINQKLIVTILEQNGYSTTTANNGQIAVDLYEESEFDVILMDIDMPVMDGITATRVIKEIGQRDKRCYTPIIALTARALAGDRERILSAGLDAHLSKPVDREFLLNTLDQYIKMKDERNRNFTPSV